MIELLPLPQVLDGLKTGNAALKRANEMFSIEEIERIMDDTAEAVEKQREIDELLSGQLTREDEDDVLAELDRLEAEEEEEGVAAAAAVEGEEGVADLMPEVPTDELPSKERERRRKGTLIFVGGLRPINVKLLYAFFTPSS